MGIAINIDANLVKDAKRYSAVESRSIAKQIEYWAKIGRTAEQNPDLSYYSIKEILLGLEDYQSGNIEEYDSNNL